MPTIPDFAVGWHPVQGSASPSRLPWGGQAHSKIEPRHSPPGVDTEIDIWPCFRGADGQQYAD